MPDPCALISLVFIHVSSHCLCISVSLSLPDIISAFIRLFRFVCMLFLSPLLFVLVFIHSSSTSCLQICLYYMYVFLFCSCLYPSNFPSPYFPNPLHDPSPYVFVYHFKSVSVFDAYMSVVCLSCLSVWIDNKLVFMFPLSLYVCLFTCQCFL